MSSTSMPAPASVFDEPASPDAQPVDAATAVTAIPQDLQPHRWSIATRVGFRFAFCYFTAYCLANGNATVWETIPKLGEKIEGYLANIFLLPAQFLARRLFHVPPPGDTIHPTGSGDTAINWIAVLLMLVLSACITAVWSIVAERSSRRRLHYQTLAAWLRFLIRLTIGFGMVEYGLSKVFPLQMPSPSIGSLAEPLGMHSPMNVLWSFIGLNPVYEILCGSAELLGGLLLLFRRTALAGAIFTAFVVSNVLLYNLCFDVPVKLYAGHLLLLSLFVILPDVEPLFRFFWLHQGAPPTGVWVPPSSRLWFRRTTIAIEIVFAVLALGGVLEEVSGDWRTTRAARIAPCPLRGAWRIDTATILGADGSPLPHPVLSEDKHPYTELDITTAERASFRDDTGKSTGYPLKTDTAQHTLTFTRPDESKIAFTARTPDPAHLILTPTGVEAHSASTLSLTLVSPPGGYPLLSRGFHWVSEYPYQR